MKCPGKSYLPPEPSVSDRMKRVPRRDTKIERRMKEILHDNGFRYRSQPPNYGKPDFRIPHTSVLIFCDSSFWHGRRLARNRFSKNEAFWVAKLRYNRSRDLTVSRVLRQRGWAVLRFWDDDIMNRPDKVIQRLCEAVYGLS